MADQVLVLGHIAQSRTATTGFSPSDVEELFLNLALPRAARTSNVMARLEGRALLTRGRGRGAVWRVTPEGREHIRCLDLIDDLPALLSEVENVGSSRLGGAIHPLLPPELAPPELLRNLDSFLKAHPFETNVFAMTRFPEAAGNSDPLRDALEAARTACSSHGLELHLASDHAIVDDLWANVAAYMWACRYGVAFFEDTRGVGVNHNMTIEVGGMLMTGRRCALLKDTTIAKLPTDLVGRIYKPVDVASPESVFNAVHEWISRDLQLGPCHSCVAA